MKDKLAGHQILREIQHGTSLETMYNLHLSAEQLEIRDTVREFVNEEVKPVTLKSSRLDACDRTLPLEAPPRITRRMV